MQLKGRQKHVSINCTGRALEHMSLPYLITRKLYTRASHWQGAIVRFFSPQYFRMKEKIVSLEPASLSL